jgi:hypothetical protein
VAASTFTFATTTSVVCLLASTIVIAFPLNVLIIAASSATTPAPTPTTEATVGPLLTSAVIVWAPTVDDDAWLQISQLVVLDNTNTNVALNKPCSASSVYGSDVCGNALDGTLSNRISPIFHAGTPSGAWFRVELGGNFSVVKVVYYNRLSNYMRAGGSLLQLLDHTGTIIAQRTLTSNQVQTFTFSTFTPSVPSTTYYCRNDIFGGSWVLVRRVRASTTWHPATDTLTGTQSYGTYGSETSDSTFSVQYFKWVKSSTQFLFMSGACVHVPLFSSC